MLDMYRLHEGYTAPVAEKAAPSAGTAAGLFARTCVHGDGFGASFGPASKEAGRARNRELEVCEVAARGRAGRGVEAAGPLQDRVTST